MTDTTTSVSSHRRVRRLRRETRPIRGNLTLAAALLVTFAVYTWLVVNWSPFIRLDNFLNRNFHIQAYWPELHLLDRVGQRAVCLPILIGVIVFVGWRHRSWRPVLLGVIGVFVVNLLVLIVKLALSRGGPLSGTSFFADGDLYPSGHTANIVVIYGLCYHVITHYGRVSTMVKRLLLTVLCMLPVVMFTTSLLLRWHWFSDLIGGFMIGGAVLALTVGIDAAIPFRSHKLVVLPPRPAPETPPTSATSTASAEPVGARSRSIAGQEVTRRRKSPGSHAAGASRPSHR